MKQILFAALLISCVTMQQHIQAKEDSKAVAHDAKHSLVSAAPKKAAQPKAAKASNSAQKKKQPSLMKANKKPAAAHPAQHEKSKHAQPMHSPKHGAQAKKKHQEMKSAAFAKKASSPQVDDLMEALKKAKEAKHHKHAASPRHSMHHAPKHAAQQAPAKQKPMHAHHEAQALIERISENLLAAAEEDAMIAQMLAEELQSVNARLLGASPAHHAYRKLGSLSSAPRKLGRV